MLVCRSRSPQAARDRGDIGQLHRALDRRVAGENLLEQCRTGARHSHDEDRICSSAPGAAALAEKFRGIGIARTLQTQARVLRAVRDHFQSQRITGGVVRERWRVLGAVFERLAQRELDTDAVFLLEIGAGECVAHRFEVRIFKPDGL